MSETWHARVQSYVNQLQQIAGTIESILKQTHVETTELDSAKMQSSIGELESALAQLAEKIALREELLRASDAPGQGLTLTAKLRSTLRLQDARLARQCEQVAELIANTNRRAVSLFVCQYHLSEFSSEIVRLLAGTSMRSTYDSAARHHNGGSGGLFNESA